MGSTTEIACSAYVEIGTVYYYGDTPAQIITLIDEFDLQTFTAEIVDYIIREKKDEY